MRQVADLGAVSAQTSMNTAALVTNQHTPIHRGPARLCDGGDNRQNHDTCSDLTVESHQISVPVFLLGTTNLRCESEIVERTILHHLALTGVIYICCIQLFLSSHTVTNH